MQCDCSLIVVTVVLISWYRLMSPSVFSATISIRFLSIFSQSVRNALSACRPSNLTFTCNCASSTYIFSVILLFIGNTVTTVALIVDFERRKQNNSQQIKSLTTTLITVRNKQMHLSTIVQAKECPTHGNITKDKYHFISNVAPSNKLQSVANHNKNHSKMHRCV